VIDLHYAVFSKKDVVGVWALKKVAGHRIGPPWLDCSPVLVDLTGVGYKVLGPCEKETVQVMSR
jgi:hypothetical protein